MRIADLVQGTLTKLASMRATLRRQSAFTCEDCERMERCGLPPSDECIEKAAQIERGWKRPPKLTSWPYWCSLQA
jgi:hypothetical protein